MRKPWPRTRRRLARIRQLRRLGWTQKQIGQDLGIAAASVSQLIREYIDDREENWPSGQPAVARDYSTFDELYERWMIDHNICAMGVRAVKETA